MLLFASSDTPAVRDDMPNRILRLHDPAFRYLIIGVGLTWSAAFAVIALFFSPLAGLD
jgi:hypothetical protein